MRQPTHHEVRLVWFERAKPHCVSTPRNIVDPETLGSNNPARAHRFAIRMILRVGDASGLVLAYRPRCDPRCCSTLTFYHHETDGDV